MPGQDRSINQNLDNGIPNADALRAAETAYQDSLISYVIYLTKKQLEPDKDKGVSFYYGVITNIITDDTPNYDRRDIFHSYIDRAERTNYTTVKPNTSRTIYFVHIPALHSIFFNNENFASEKKELFPEDLFKFRIEVLSDSVERDKVQIGSLVKIRFEDNNRHKNGVIEGVVEQNILQLLTDKNTQQAVLENFEDYRNCLQDPLVNASGQGRIIFSSVLTNKDVMSLGLFDFFEYFTNSFAPEAEKKFASADTTVVYSFDSSPNSFNNVESFRASNQYFNDVPLIVESQFVTTGKYFIRSEGTITQANIIRLKIDTANDTLKSNLLNYFAVILKSSYGLNTSIVDGNLQIEFDIQQLEETDFLSYSQGRYEILKEYNISPTKTQFSKQEVTDIQNATSNPNNVPCENIITTDLYINTSKSEGWTRVNDKVVLDHFFENKKSGIKSYDDYQIVNSTDAINLSPFSMNKVVASSNSFYFYSKTESDKTFEENGLVTNGGRISVEKVESNLKLLKKDLNTLRQKIAKNESVTDQSVLILPINWFEPKPLVKVPAGRDPNSQHWYGRAVDFVVYIKIGSTIYQIPPDVIYLYIQKFLKPTHQNIGMGLFTSGGTYIHYEILDGLEPSKVKNRFWTVETGGDELEKQLNEVSPSDFTITVENFVKSKRVIPGIGLPQKIRNLL